MFDSLTAVVHGESGVGKSWFGDSVPGPRLILDAEGGSRFTPSKPKILWDPQADAPPAPGEWETCVTFVRDFGTLSRVFAWLNSGNHPFVSVVMDSLTEIQKRCLDAIVGTNAPQTQDWGSLLRQMEGLVRQYRDLTMHPTKPLKCVLFLCLSSEKGRNGKISAHLQGQLGTTLPGFVDLVGYLYTEVDPDRPGHLHRKLLVQPYDGFQAKDRTDVISKTFGAVIDVEKYGVVQIMQAINGQLTVERQEGAA